MFVIIKFQKNILADVMMMMMMFLTSLDVIKGYHQLSTIFSNYIMSQSDKDTKWLLLFCYSMVRTIGKEKKQKHKATVNRQLL